MKYFIFKNTPILSSTLSRTLLYYAFYDNIIMMTLKKFKYNSFSDTTKPRSTF